MNRPAQLRTLALALLAVLPVAHVATADDDSSASAPTITSSVLALGRATLDGKDMTPQADGDWWFNLTVVFRDADGWQDLSKLEARLYKTSSTAAPRCGWTTRGSGGQAVEYGPADPQVRASGDTAEVTFSYRLEASDAADKFAWKVEVHDRSGAKDTRCEDGYRKVGVLGIRVSPGSLLFPGLDPGAPETAGVPQKVLLENVGTVPAKVRYSAVALTHTTGGSLPTQNLYLATSPDLADRQPFPAAGAEGELANALPAGATREVFLVLKVPLGTMAGTYSGTVTFAGVSA